MTNNGTMATIQNLEQSLSTPSTNLVSPQSLLGGSNPEAFDWAEAWYPVHYVADLDKAVPTRFTLLDQDVVIWWEPAAKTWRVFSDRCPHRLVPLSEGRINEEGQLECPYHGWTFSGEGACESIPQQPESSQANQSLRACVRSFPTVIHQDLLFVYAGQAENAPSVPVPTIAPLEEDPDGWVMLNTFRDLPYDALTLLENVIDASHIPYTHHKTVGKRENAAPMEMDILESGKYGFKGIWPEGPRKGKLGTQRTTFIAPGMMYHDLTSKQFGRTMTVVYATPIRKGECRLFARFPFKFSAKLPQLLIKLMPRWYSHIGNNGVLEDDQIFLHLQERTLAKASHKPYAQNCYLPTQADRYVVALRKWVSDFQAEPFAEQPFTPELPKEVLLDRYHSHTKHCRSCSQALKRIQQIRLAAAIASGLVWSLIPLVVVLSSSLTGAIGIVLTVLPLVSSALWLWLGTLERKFYEGQAIPPRNLS